MDFSNGNTSELVTAFAVGAASSLVGYGMGTAAKKPGGENAPGTIKKVVSE